MASSKKPDTAALTGESDGLLKGVDAFSEPGVCRPSKSRHVFQTWRRGRGHARPLPYV